MSDSIGRLQLKDLSYEYLPCYIISKNNFWLENISSTSSFNEHQHLCAFVITLLFSHRMSNIFPLFLNQSGIERRSHFSVHPIRIVPELHIPNDDRCPSNLRDIKEGSMNT